MYPYDVSSQPAGYSRDRSILCHTFVYMSILASWVAAVDCIISVGVKTRKVVSEASASGCHAL